MMIKQKKLRCGFSLPLYGFGLWQVGGGRETDKSRDVEEIEALRAAIESGIVHFDTAELYGDGHAEELLGIAIKDYPRDKLFLASKVSSQNHSYESLLKSAEASLKRMGTEYMDLYLLHKFPDPGINLAETMQAMDEVVKRGWVRHIGVCNFSPNRLREAQNYTKNKIVCNQLHYNLEYREVEKYDLLSFCEEMDVMLVAWRPVQKGALPESALLNELAKKYNKTPIQLAINWLVSQPNVVTISKTSNPAHLKENIEALDFIMEPSDIEKLRSEFPNQKNRSDSIPLDHPGDTPS